MRTVWIALLSLVALCDAAIAQTVERDGETLLVRGTPSTVELSKGVPVSIALDETPGAVVVGDPDIADVDVIGNRSIVIIPKKVGMTAVVLTDKNGRLIARIVVPVNDPNTVSIWESGKRTSHWCTSEICLSDFEVKKKNDQNKEDAKTVLQIRSSSTSSDAAGPGDVTVESTSEIQTERQ